MWLYVLEKMFSQDLFLFLIFNIKMTKDISLKNWHVKIGSRRSGYKCCMLASSAEDRGFGFLSVQNNYHNIGICCLTEEQRKTTACFVIRIVS